MGYLELLDEFSNCIPLCEISKEDHLEFWQNDRHGLLIRIDKYINRLQTMHKMIYGDNLFFAGIIVQKRKLDAEIQRSFNCEKKHDYLYSYQLTDETISNIRHCYAAMSSFVSETIAAINEHRLITAEKIDFLNKDYRKVFLVHGRNEILLKKIKRFLTKENIEAVVLKDNTGSGINFIWNKFLGESSFCRAAIIIASSDIISQNDKFARPNVYLELGYFLGKLLPSNIIMLLDDPSIVPSDVQGIEYINYCTEKDWMTKLERKIRKMGF